jgi:3-oxoacyl-[acyl-carrier protein] reductase
MRRRALITGSSRGLGAAIAREFAHRGIDVIVHCRAQVDRAHAVVSEVQALGVSASLVSFDVADSEATSHAMTTLLAQGPIDILVNNAGVHHDASFPALEEEAWHRVVRTNLDSFFYVTKPCVMPMVRQKWGRIINMSSVAGVVGNRGQVNYSAAKSGIHGATKALAQELARRNITVNAVAPGLIDSEMLEGMVPEAREAAMQLIPMRRLGRAEEVAKLVAFLASDDASYITGQIININGGMVG